MSQGEKDVGDLLSDAWLLSFKIAERQGRPFDFLNFQDQHLLIRWLNFEVNRRADLPFRFAERPDGCDEELSLWDVLAADSTADPLERLIANQDQSLADELRANSFSEFAAYCISWQNMGQAMVDLAQHLAITSDTLLNRFKRARTIMMRQDSLFDTVVQIPEDFVPLPSRSFAQPLCSCPLPQQSSLDV